MMESEGEGHGMSAVDPKEAESVAFTACELADLVGMGAAPESELPEEDLRKWAVEKVAELKRLVAAAEGALEEEFDEFQDAAEKLKTAAQTYALGIRGWGSGQPLDPLLDE